MRTRMSGCLVILTLMALSCCILPPLYFRIAFGSLPIGDPSPYQLTEGMTRDEVQAIMGRPPHDRRMDGSKETWVYYCDFLYAGVWQIRFDENGLVESIWW